MPSIPSAVADGTSVVGTCFPFLPISIFFHLPCNSNACTLSLHLLPRSLPEVTRLGCQTVFPLLQTPPQRLGCYPIKTREGDSTSISNDNPQFWAILSNFWPINCFAIQFGHIARCFQHRKNHQLVPGQTSSIVRDNLSSPQIAANSLSPKSLIWLVLLG